MAKPTVRMVRMKRIVVSIKETQSKYKRMIHGIFLRVFQFTVAIAPLAADLLKPEPMVPYLPRFHSEGFAVFSEKGVVGKLCAEGLEADSKLIVRQTVAESLCKSLGYE